MESQRVEAAAPLAAALEEREWDLVIADYNVPGLGGLMALKDL